MVSLLLRLQSWEGKNFAPLHVSPQFLDQAHASALRLSKSYVPDHAARPFICDAEYRLAATIVRQSTAVPEKINE
jgi:hypothetical protein